MEEKKVIFNKKSFVIGIVILIFIAALSLAFLYFNGTFDKDKTYKTDTYSINYNKTFTLKKNDAKALNKYNFVSDNGDVVVMPDMALKVMEYYDITNSKEASELYKIINESLTKEYGIGKKINLAESSKKINNLSDNLYYISYDYKILINKKEVPAKLYYIISDETGYPSLTINFYNENGKDFDKLVTKVNKMFKSIKFVTKTSEKTTVVGSWTVLGNTKSYIIKSNGTYIFYENRGLGDDGHSGTYTAISGAKGAKKAGLSYEEYLSADNGVTNNSENFFYVEFTPTNQTIKGVTKELKSAEPIKMTFAIHIETNESLTYDFDLEKYFNFVRNTDPVD